MGKYPIIESCTLILCKLLKGKYVATGGFILSITFLILIYLKDY